VLYNNLQLSLSLRNSLLPDLCSFVALSGVVTGQSSLYCLTNILSSTTVFNMDNSTKSILSTKSEYYRMISEGSCDIEDWTNDVEN